MKTSSWSILATLALCSAFAGPACAQLAQPIDQVMRSALMPVTATPDTLDCCSLQHFAGDINEKDVNWVGNAGNFTQLERPVMPGTIARTSPTPLKPMHNTAFSVEPGSLPSWITDQPLAYLTYGAAPAAVTLHFGHK